jgi:RHS repeat-associated protein
VALSVIVLLLLTTVPTGSEAAGPAPIDPPALPSAPTPPAAPPVPQSAPQPPSPGPDPLSALFAAVGPADVAEASRQREDALRQAARLATSEARGEREQSRVRYRGLDPGAALDVARARHGRWLSEPAWSPPRPGPFERLGRILGDNAVRIHRDGEDSPAVAVSPTPLVSDLGSGQRQLIDLSLRESGDRFEARNPLVRAWLPERLQDGFVFSPNDIELRFGGDDSVTARRVGDKLFYANVATDTDLVAEAVPSGVSTFYQLRSPAAPSSLDVTVAPGDGAFELIAGGGAQLRQDGDGVLGVSAPVAIDAQGAPVDARFAIVDGALRIDVDHHARDVAYPILVDPTYVRIEQAYTGFYGWQFGTPWPGFFSGGYCPTCSPDYGLYLQSAAGSFFGNLTWGWWAMPTPNYSGGTAYTFRMDWHTVRHRAPVYACISLGMFVPSANDWERGGQWNDVANPGSGPGPYVDCTARNGAPTTCARPGCAWDATPGTHPAFQQWMYGDGTRAGSDLAWVGNPIVFMSDYDDPTVERTYWSTGEGPTGWTRYPMLFGQMKATDRGLGVFYLEPEPSAGLLVTPDYGVWDCSGDWSPPRCENWRAMNYDVQPQWDGIHTITLHAADVIDRWAAPYTHQVKYDATAPDVRYSGRLASLGGRSIDQSVKLDISAQDGSATHPRSGVQGAWIYVDGTLVNSKANSQCAQSCALSHSYTFNPASYTPGDHTVRVDVWDWAGNMTTQSWQITVAGGKLPSVQEGERTGRRLVLRAQRTRGSATAVRFQYRYKEDAGWQDVPVSAVRTQRGDAVSAWPVALDAVGASPTLVWDVLAAPGALDGPVHVRGVFSGNPETVTEDVRTELDQSGVGSDDATEQFGPVSVDLLTGNASVQQTDVKVEAFKADLTVTRTYNSRSRPESGSASAPPGIPPALGPGWTLGIESESAGADFSKIVNMAEIAGDAQGPYAVAHATLGGELPFEEEPLDTSYISQLGFEDLSLQRHHLPDGRIERFTLSDRATGHVMTFIPSGVTGEYVLSRVDQPGTADQLSLSYETVAGHQGVRVTRMTAPPPPGVQSCTTLVRGCRALHFDYATTTGNGDYAGRLRQIRMLAWDPQQGAMADVPVARYDYDAQGRLIAAWDPRIIPAVKTSYSYHGSDSQLATITPPGELPWTLTYGTGAGSTPVWLEAVTRPALAPETGVARYGVRYGEPLSVSGRYDLRASSLDEIGQQDVPVTATEINRPSTGGETLTTVHFLNGYGRQVNTWAPADRVTTTEFDERGNVVRELTAANRLRALAPSTTAERAALAEKLSTRFWWDVNDAGARLRQELGPQHRIETSSGAQVDARKQTNLTYDEERPDTKDYNLPTTTTVSALVTGGTVTDARVTKTTYDFAKRLPLTTTVVGENLVTRTVYDENGLAVERRLPRDEDGTAASTIQTIRYTAGSNPVPECGNRPEWAGMACIERPAAQPTLGTGRHPIPESRFEYDLLANVTVEREQSPSATRTTTITYDGAGRRTQQAVSATRGASVPTISWAYDRDSGKLLETTSTLGQDVKSVRQTYDDLGRPGTYTDAHGTVTTTTYDLADRAIEITNDAGVQRLEYDSEAGALHRLLHPGLGWISATRDADGNIVSENFETADVQLQIDYNAIGVPTRRAYVKTSQCTTGCVWATSSAIETIHGQWADHASSESSQQYRYDAAGRLTQVDDNVSGPGCTRRAYSYDKDSNRLASSSSHPAITCGTTSTSTGHSYDEADRIIDAGYMYDELGRITTVPARDAGGHELTLDYYSNDLVHRLSQAGREIVYTLDPGMRIHARSGPDGTEATHYADDSDEPAWTSKDGAIHQELVDAQDELVAVRKLDGTGDEVSLQLTNLHGDVVADIPNNPNALPPDMLVEADEFGAPKIPTDAPPIERIGGTMDARSTAGTTLTISRPPSLRAGDVMIAQIAGDADATITAPTGWTRVPEADVVGGESRVAVFWRNAAETEPASYQFTFSAAGKHRGGISALRNVDLRRPINRVAVETRTGPSINTPSVTPTVDDAALMTFVAADILQDGTSNAALLFEAPLVKDWDTWDLSAGAYATDRTAASATTVLDGGRDTETGSYAVSNPRHYASYTAITLAIAPAPAAPEARYRWLGAHQRATEFPSGVVLMGARVYLPQIGRFAQPDPVAGGSANTYDYANQDPLNTYDLDGRQVYCNGGAHIRRRGSRVRATARSICGGNLRRIKRHVLTACLQEYDYSIHTYTNVMCATNRGKAAEVVRVRFRTKCTPGFHRYRLSGTLAVQLRNGTTVSNGWSGRAWGVFCGGGGAGAG